MPACSPFQYVTCSFHVTRKPGHSSNSCGMICSLEITVLRQVPRRVARQGKGRQRPLVSCSSPTVSASTAVTTESKPVFSTAVAGHDTGSYAVSEELRLEIVSGLLDYRTCSLKKPRPSASGSCWQTTRITMGVVAASGRCSSISPDSTNAKYRLIFCCGVDWCDPESCQSRLSEIVNTMHPALDSLMTSTAPGSSTHTCSNYLLSAPLEKLIHSKSAPPFTRGSGLDAFRVQRE